jgi:hypothetical protein
LAVKRGQALPADNGVETMRAVIQEQADHEPVVSKKKAAFRNAAFPPQDLSLGIRLEEQSAARR